METAGGACALAGRDEAQDGIVERADASAAWIGADFQIDSVAAAVE